MAHLASSAPTEQDTLAVLDSRPMAAKAAVPLARVYAALALGIVCIGLSAIFTVDAQVPGTVSAFYRVGIAAVVLAPLFVRNARRASGTSRPATFSGGGRIWLLAAAAGLFFMLDVAVWNTSLFLTNAANATLMANVAPIVVGLVALLVFRERLGVIYWIGLAIALGGMGIIVGHDVLDSTGFGGGDLLAMLAGVFYALYLLVIQRVRVWMDTLSSLWISTAVGTVLLLGLNLALGRPLWGFTASQYLVLLALGLISQVAGYLAINYALGHLPASIVSPTLLGQPILTALLAVPLLGESLEPRQIIGGLVALGGIFLVNRGVNRR